MALDIFFAEDIHNALVAAEAASRATADLLITTGDVQALINYRRGYRAALITVALAFGVEPVVGYGWGGDLPALLDGNTKRGAPL